MSSIGIKPLTLGELDTNCYLVWCESTRECVIIDPADAGEAIVEEILSEQLKPTAILLTHGHFDHVLGSLTLKLSFDLPMYLHPADGFLLEQAQQSAEHWLKHPVDPVPFADKDLSNGQTLQFGNVSLKVMHTPGHTPGSCTFFWQSRNKQADKEHFLFAESNILFCGDLIFANGVGRTDFRYSKKNELWRSIEMLRSEYKGSQCLAGHGESFILE